MAGQGVYHLMAAAHAARAPWPVVMLVSCLPVLTLVLFFFFFSAAPDSHFLLTATTHPSPTRDLPRPGL